MDQKLNLKNSGDCRQVESCKNLHVTFAQLMIGIAVVGSVAILFCAFLCMILPAGSIRNFFDGLIDTITMVVVIGGIIAAFGIIAVNSTFNKDPTANQSIGSGLPNCYPRTRLFLNSSNNIISRQPISNMYYNSTNPRYHSYRAINTSGIRDTDTVSSGSYNPGSRYYRLFH